MKVLAAVVATAGLLAVVALLSSNSADSAFGTGRSLLSSSDDCNILEATENWWHAYLENDAPKYAAAYHRNALRYDNGELSALTGGVPISVDQFNCVRDRVDSRVVLRNIGRDKVHKFVGITYDLYVEDFPVVSFYTSLEFDRSSCRISVERNFFDATSSGIAGWVDAVNGECFGSDMNTNPASFDMASTFSNFLESWVNENLKKMTGFTVPTAAFTVNGQRIPNFLSKDFQDLLWSETTMYSLSLDNVVRRVADSTLVATFSFQYAIDKDLVSQYGTSAFSALCHSIVNFNDDGLIKQLDLVCHGLDQAMAAGQVGAPFPKTFPFFANNQPRSEAPNAVRNWGKPDLFMLQEGGFLYWNDADGCYDETWISDEDVVHPPRNQFDGSLAHDCLYTTVSVQIPGNRIEEVLALSPSIWYSPVAKKLTVRSDTLASNLALTVLALRVVDGAPANETQTRIVETEGLVYNFAAGMIVRNLDGTPKYTKNYDKLAMEICTLSKKFQ